MQTATLMNNVANNVAVTQLKNADRWQAPEFVFWLLPIAAYFVFPSTFTLCSNRSLPGVMAIITGIKW